MKRSNEFIQSEVYSCGACCIESVVSYYGGYVPHETVLADTLTDTNGTNAYNMIKALKKYGFNAQGLKIKIDDLKSLRLPLIAHIIDKGYEHFIVIYKVSKNSINVMNPKVGFKKYDIQNFQNIFNGIVIILAPINKIVTYSNNIKLYSFYKNMMKGKYKSVILLFIINLIFITLSILSSLFFKVLESTNRIIYVTFIFILIGFLKYIIYTIKDIYKRRLGIALEKDNYLYFFNTYFNLEYQYIMNKRSGEILKKVCDLSIVKDVFLWMISDVIMDIFLFVISLVYLFMISFNLGFISLISLVVISLLFLLFNKLIYYREKEYNDEKNTHHGDFIEYTESIESVKNIHKEDMIFKRINTSFDKMIKSKYKFDNVEMCLNVIRYLTLDSFYIVIMGLGMYSVNKGLLSIMDILVFNALYSLTISSLHNIIDFIYSYINSKVITREIGEFCNLKKDIKTKVNESFQKIEIKNLNLSFDAIHDVFKDFNYTIIKGDKILVAGESGIGKSSLAKCISGLINSYDGKILINNKINIQLNSIIYIGQRETIYTGTVKENIILDKSVNESLYDICKLCHIDSQNMLDKYVINNGENISKGEKARIVLARALYLKPEVLIIDEVLSSVSEDVENNILNNLLKKRELTLIYITHRDKRGYFKKIINLERKDLIGAR